VNRVGTLIVGAFLVVAFAAVLAPEASAHSCKAKDPPAKCGECYQYEVHDHRYQDGSLYCSSDGRNPPIYVA
jgi:hypothetical protein